MMDLLLRHLRKLVDATGLAQFARFIEDGQIVTITMHPEKDGLRRVEEKREWPNA